MASSWPHPAYRVETPRLVLRCYEPGDVAETLRAVLASRRHLARWMPWITDEPPTIEEQREVIRRFRGNFDLGTDFVYGIFDAAAPATLVGGCGLHDRVGPRALEIGYWIASDRLREGLATEAAAALTRVGFEIMGVRRMEIRCDPLNIASAGVPRRLGYARDGLLRWNQVQGDGSMRDTLVHSLTADDYRGSPAAALAIAARGFAGQPLPLSSPSGSSPS